MLSSLLALFPAIGDSLLNLRNGTSALALLLVNADKAGNAALWNDAAKQLSTSIDQDSEKVLAAFTGNNYPFAHAGGTLSVPDFLCDCLPVSEQIVNSFRRGRLVFERAMALYYRILARLAYLGQRQAGASG